ncbi:MAG: peptidoglycan-binding protein [Comamonadaceae bacterium]|nr:MAG: peptidoglycan-binding protein [Comamonadaceae bacterium]
MNTTAIQWALFALGYSLVVDGAMGPKRRAALQTFQRGAGLVAEGIAGPRTQAALAAARARAGIATVLKLNVSGPWHEDLLRRKGLHETRHRSKLKAWLRSDGKTLGDPAKLPWCGEAIQTCLALTSRTSRSRQIRTSRATG